MSSFTNLRDRGALINGVNLREFIVFILGEFLHGETKQCSMFIFDDFIEFVLQVGEFEADQENWVDLVLCFIQVLLFPLNSFQ